MRWNGQRPESMATDALPGLESTETSLTLSGLVRSVRPPEFAGLTFHEVLAKSALNRVPGGGGPLPFGWTINPYRGCSHACVYCFARPTHEYLDLDAGRDFDAQVVVKLNVAEVLARELARPGWRGDPVALGTNTDPYQRAEGRYALMPGIIEALAARGTPFSVLTKGTLLRRDLPLLQRAAQQVPVDLSMSIAIYDRSLQQSLEPGTPTTDARLATLTAAVDAGFAPSVFLMPLLPDLTDTRAHLDEAFARIRAAGGRSVAHSSLRLGPGVREWFFAWLEREHPQRVNRYRALYAEGPYPPTAYRDWLRRRVEETRRRHGVARPHLDATTGTVRSRALAGSREGRAPRSASVVSPQQATLF